MYFGCIMLPGNPTMLHDMHRILPWCYVRGPHGTHCLIWKTSRDRPMWIAEGRTLVLSFLSLLQSLFSFDYDSSVRSHQRNNAGATMLSILTLALIPGILANPLYARQNATTTSSNGTSTALPPAQVTIYPATSAGQGITLAGTRNAVLKTDQYLGIPFAQPRKW